MLRPGPRTPAVWQTLRFVTSPRKYSRATAARYGRAVRFHVLNGKGVSVSHPDLALQVFAADPSGFDTIPVFSELFGLASVLATSYLGAVICETLRIEPIVTDVSRICRQPLALGPWQVPQGELALVNVSAILDDPELFPEPRRFRPERFLERTFSAAEFLPFGGGHRRCLGAAFAEAELAIALAAIVSGWSLDLAEKEPERSVRRNITMGPKNGVRVRVLG
jgi:cytochrome P450